MKNKYQEAFENIESLDIWSIPFSTPSSNWGEYLKCGDDIEASYQISEDLEVIKELVDKETPMKPYRHPEWPSGDCPICKTTNIAENLYCRGCGQKIDWGDGYDLIQAGLIEKVQKEEAENETNI